MSKIITPKDTLGAQPLVTMDDEFEKRKEAFHSRVNSIGDDYGVGLVPKLAYTQDGILPVLTFIDRKPSSEDPEKPAKPKKGK